MSVFYIKRHDTAPSIQMDLKDHLNAAVDLSSATAVNFHMKSTTSNQTKVDRAAVIVGDTTGRVRYDWQSGDTDTSGEFQVEVEVLWSGGAKQTFPNSGYVTVQITSDLDSN